MSRAVSLRSRTGGAWRHLVVAVLLSVVAGFAFATSAQAAEAEAPPPVDIVKHLRASGVEGHWTWKVGKWTNQELETTAKAKTPYGFGVLVEGTGFKPTSSWATFEVGLRNRFDLPIRGVLRDTMPGFHCRFVPLDEEGEGGPTEVAAMGLAPDVPVPDPEGVYVYLKSGETLRIGVRCTSESAPVGKLVNVVTFHSQCVDTVQEEGTPSTSTTLPTTTVTTAPPPPPPPCEEGSVGAKAVVTLDRTPPKGSPGQSVVLHDPMVGNGEKGLKRFDAVEGPVRGKVAYRAELDPPKKAGACWCHHNTAHLYDMRTKERVASSNRVQIRICRPKDGEVKTGTTKPPIGKGGVPVVPSTYGGPKYIPNNKRTRLGVKVRAPKRVYRGDVFKARVVTVNRTRRTAYGVVVAVKVPRGFKLATRSKGVKSHGQFAYWMAPRIKGKQRLVRTVPLVAVKPGAHRLVARAKARNAKRAVGRARVRVMPRRVMVDTPTEVETPDTD